jgi:hypothetical protein
MSWEDYNEHHRLVDNVNCKEMINLFVGVPLLTEKCCVAIMNLPMDMLMSVSTTM